MQRRQPETLLSFVAVLDYRDLLLRRLDSVSLSRLGACRRELRGYAAEILGERRVTAADVLAGVHVTVLRWLLRAPSASDCFSCAQPLVKTSELPAEYASGWYCDLCSKNANGGFEAIAPGALVGHVPERWCCLACQSDLCCECYDGHEPGVAVEGGVTRLAAGEYALGEGEPLHLRAKGIVLLGEEGVVVKKDVVHRLPTVVITRAVDNEIVMRAWAEGVVIEKVAVRSFTEHNCAVGVHGGGVTVKDCDLRGQVNCMEGSKLLLQNCWVHNCAVPALGVSGTGMIQDCLVEDSAGSMGIGVGPIGELQIERTTIRRCQTGLMVMGTAAVGKGCSITACAGSGVYAWKTEEAPANEEGPAEPGGPGEVTVEDGAGLVCTGNNTSTIEFEADFLTVDGGSIAGVAAEKIVHA